MAIYESESRKLRTRAEELMRKLTLDEKIGMVHGAQLFQTKGVERLGIPPLKMSDGPMGVRQEFHAASWIPEGTSRDYVTYLPCNSALASTWNRELAYETGSVLGEETRGRGKDVILGPGVNIKRSPLCGRNFEYFSEDPYLTKELAAPFIRGVQNWDVAACVKHFAANNQETERLWVDVEVDEKALREIYLPAFHDAVEKAGSYTIMAAYNRLNGQHCYYNEHLLKEKIKNGEISETVLDEKVVRILMLMFRLHMMDGEKRKRGSYNTPEYREKALEVARESIVLLKNENARLPLDPDKVKKLLVIGENADCMHAAGGGSAEIKALYETTPLMGICALLGGNAEVRFAKGYIRDEQPSDTEVNWQETSLENGGGHIHDAGVNREAQAERVRLREEAVQLAAQYDDVIFVGGLNHEHDSEGNDRADMKLPYEQDILIKELLNVNPKTVIVLTGGSPVEMGEWIDSADTVVWNWYAGLEGGRALAEVLFGAVNPSGKLPETFYRRHTDCSAHVLGEFPGGDKVSYKEGVFVGYRYNDSFHVEPQFCFGHGLSYTTFQYSEAAADASEEETTIYCTVENTGKTAGKETVQVYFAPVGRKNDEPVQELKGFEKISLMPGEKKRVEIHAEPCRRKMEIRIGASSRDIRTVICTCTVF